MLVTGTLLVSMIYETIILGSTNSEHKQLQMNLLNMMHTPI